MIIHYIFVRSDIPIQSTGILLAQCSHASISSIYKFLNIEETINYLKDIENMRTIVKNIKKKDICILQDFFERNRYDYISWKEQPENIITALALRPYEMENEKELKKFFKKFDLF